MLYAAITIIITTGLYYLIEDIAKLVHKYSKIKENDKLFINSLMLDCFDTITCCGKEIHLIDFHGFLNPFNAGALTIRGQHFIIIRRYYLFTRPERMEIVLWHEVGHIVKGHTRIGWLASYRNKVRNADNHPLKFWSTKVEVEADLFAAKIVDDIDLMIEKTVNVLCESPGEDEYRTRVMKVAEFAAKQRRVA